MDFEPANRKKFCARICYGKLRRRNHGHSQFEKIPMSKERQERLLEEQIEEITEGIAELKESRAERFTIKELERTRKNLQVKLEKLQAEGKKDNVVTFEELGVDRLYVDEAHSFKNALPSTPKCGMLRDFLQLDFTKIRPICSEVPAIWMKSRETTA